MRAGNNDMSFWLESPSESFIAMSYCRLFVLPQYCGILLEQSLMLNRRRKDDEEMPKPKRVRLHQT